MAVGHFALSILLCCYLHSATAELNPAPLTNQKSQASSCNGKLADVVDAYVNHAYSFSKSVNFQSIRQSLEFFTGERLMWGGFRLHDRYDPEGREISRYMILRRLRELGYWPEVEAFAGGANIFAEIPGSEFPNDVIELGTHFDSEGPGVKGASDNGTGLVWLLHMAELFQKYPPGRTVRLVFYDLEEQEGEGSTARAQAIDSDPRNFIGALIVDEIGYWPAAGKNPLLVLEYGETKPARDFRVGNSERRIRDGHRKKALPTPLTDEQADSLNARNKALAEEIYYQLHRLPIERRIRLSPEIENSNPEFADTGSYWENNKAAVLIAPVFGGKYDNPNVHSPLDTIENMNWEFFENSVSMITEVAGYLARVQSPAGKSVPPPVEQDQSITPDNVEISDSLPREKKLIRVRKKKQDPARVTPKGFAPALLAQTPPAIQRNSDFTDVLARDKTLTEEMLLAAKKRMYELNSHQFTAYEIAQFAKFSKLPVGRRLLVAQYSWQKAAVAYGKDAVVVSTVSGSELLSVFGRELALRGGALIRCPPDQHDKVTSSDVKAYADFVFSQPIGTSGHLAGADQSYWAHYSPIMENK